MANGGTRYALDSSNGRTTPPNPVEVKYRFVTGTMPRYLRYKNVDEVARVLRDFVAAGIGPFLP